MISYSAYKVLHLFGVVCMFTALGGTLLHVVNGGSRDNNSARALVGSLHGIGLVVLLVSGFGALARLGLGGFPGWVWAKLVIWLVFGGMAALVHRRPHLAGSLLWFLPILGGVAAYLAIYKPF